jgi:phage N-6-adenine-methyltransferase
MTHPEPKQYVSIQAYTHEPDYGRMGVAMGGCALDDPEAKKWAVEHWETNGDTDDRRGDMPITSYDSLAKAEAAAKELADKLGCEYRSPGADQPPPSKPKRGPGRPAGSKNKPKPAPAPPSSGTYEEGAALGFEEGEAQGESDKQECERDKQTGEYDGDYDSDAESYIRNGLFDEIEKSDEYPAMPSADFRRGWEEAFVKGYNSVYPPITQAVPEAEILPPIDRATLIATIKQGHQMVLHHVGKSLEGIQITGDALNALKDITPLGEWTAIREVEFPEISERRAQRYMRIARHGVSGEASQRKALAVLTKPKIYEQPDEDEASEPVPERVPEPDEDEVPEPDEDEVPEPDEDEVPEPPQGKGKPGDDWGTPQDLFDLLDGVFHFTVDAAATPTNTKVPGNYFSLPDRDAKKQSVGPGDVVWCNPPFSEIAEWVAMFARWAADGALVIAVIPAWRLDSYWWRTYIAPLIKKGRVGYPKRLTFTDANGKPAKSSAPFSCVIGVFDPPEVTPIPLPDLAPPEPVPEPPSGTYEEGIAAGKVHGVGFGADDAKSGEPCNPDRHLPPHEGMSADDIEVLKALASHEDIVIPLNATADWLRGWRDGFNPAYVDAYNANKPTEDEPTKDDEPEGEDEPVIKVRKPTERPLPKPDGEYRAKPSNTFPRGVAVVTDHNPIRLRILDYWFKTEKAAYAYAKLVGEPFAAVNANPVFNMKYWK